jgi:hypothetical protein
MNAASRRSGSPSPSFPSCLIPLTPTGDEYTVSGYRRRQAWFSSSAGLASVTIGSATKGEAAVLTSCSDATQAGA